MPYRTRINRIATYYRRAGRAISIYDSITLAIIVVLVALLLFVTDTHAVSFITGLIVGMLLIQIFLDRFDNASHQNRHLPNHQRRHAKLMSSAIQVDPAWPGGKSSSRQHRLCGLWTNSSARSSARHIRRVTSHGAGQIPSHTVTGRRGPPSVLSGAENDYGVHTLGERITIGRRHSVSAQELRPSATNPLWRRGNERGPDW